MLEPLVRKLEDVLFGRRGLVLCALLAFTAVMAVFALQLRMDAGFEKQMPAGHPYIETARQYEKDLFGANRLTVVVQARQGDIWTAQGLGRLLKVTEAVLTYVATDSDRKPRKVPPIETLINPPAKAE